MVEILGIVASILIIIGFINNDAKHIRIWNCIGCVLYVIYGLIIGSLSVCLLNSICVGINVSKIRSDLETK